VRLTLIPLAALCALALTSCADTVQQKPIPHNILEGLVVAPYPVYWLGASFLGKPLSEASHDPGGAYSVLYGSCLQGGQGTCVPPLRLVSSPDNGFLPGGGARAHEITVRGAPATLTQQGRTIIVPTGPVVVTIYAHSAPLAAAAAAAMVPINAVGAPGEALPAPVPDTGFGSQPIPAQLPSPLAPAS